MFYYDILHDAPAGLWSLDSALAGVYSDESGFDQDATFTGTIVQVEPQVSRGVSSVRVDGSKTISFPFSGGMINGKNPRPFAIEVWLKSENSSGTFTLGRGGLGLILSGTTAQFNLGGGNSISGQISMGEPVHLAAVYHGTTMSLYINNVPVNTIAVENIDFSSVVASSLTASVTLDRVVSIDTVVVYNYAITAAIINRHFVNSTNYFSIVNNAAALDAIRFEFDDLHLPVVRREVEQYGSLLDGLVVRDGQIRQVFNPTTLQFDSGTYTHIVQFDELPYGNAAQARVDWNVIGDPARVTVESSADGVSWAPVVNHGMTTNWNDLMDNNDFFLRVTLSPGADEVIFDGLVITMYSALEYTSSDINVKATVVSGNATTGLYQTNPGAFVNRDGVKLNAGSDGLRVDTHADFGNVGTLELIVKPITSQGTILANGANRIWRDATGFHFTGFDRVVVNGVDIPDGDTTLTATVGFKHIIAVLTTPNNNINYIGASSDGTSEMNFGVSYFAMHRGKMSLAEAQNLYRSYVGYPPVQILDASQVLMSEHLFPNGESYQIYAFDWSIIGGGGA